MRGDKIATCPQCGQSASEGGEFVPQHPGTPALYPCNNVVWCYCRISFYEQVNMIWHGFECNDLPVVLPYGMPDYLMQPGFNIGDDYLSLVLRAPDKMIVHEIN